MKRLPPSLPLLSSLVVSVSRLEASIVAQQGLPANPFSLPTQRVSTKGVAPREPKITASG
jgi:hypothetical protein